MAQEVILPKRIKSLSGRIGDYIYYRRNGKQFVRRYRKTVGPLSDHYRTVIGPLSSMNV